MRTFGVLTKLDLMDKGTNAVDVSVEFTAIKHVLPFSKQYSHQLGNIVKQLLRHGNFVLAVHMAFELMLGVNAYGYHLRMMSRFWKVVHTDL